MLFKVNNSETLRDFLKSSLILDGGWELKRYYDYWSIMAKNKRMWRAAFNEALKEVSLNNTVPLQNLQVPSYLYAILMDKRIRQNDW